MKQFRVEDNFQTLQVLGKGAFSTVYKVLRFADNEIYALKRVSFKNLKVKEIQNALNEIRILASVKHPNIVGYRESFIDPSTEDLCVVMNYAGGGDLSSKIRECREKKVRLPENLVIKFFYQLTSALYELHIRNVIHRDLKTANIFLSDDWKNVILGDMNVSKIVKNVFAYTQTGTPYYASPEVWRDEPYSVKTDVWSLGCVIYEMCMLKPPFNATDMDGLFEKVQKCEFDPFDNFYSKPLRESILKLMHPVPECRPNCEKILNFSIFSNLKVLLGENSLNGAAPEQFNFAQNQLLETIKPSRDFKDLDGLLPPAQYSFELQEQGNFSERFMVEGTQQKPPRETKKKSEISRLASENDRFTKKRGTPEHDTIITGSPCGPKEDNVTEKGTELRTQGNSQKEICHSQILGKALKKNPDLFVDEKKVNKTNRKDEETSKINLEKTDPPKIVRPAAPKSAKDRSALDDQNDAKLHQVIRESTVVTGTGEEGVRSRKMKNDFVTLNTINSTSNDKCLTQERQAFELQAKSILRHQRKLQELTSVELDFQKNNSREANALTHKEKIKAKPYGLKSNSNLRLDSDNSARMAPVLENVKSLGRGEENKVSKQLVKNKRRVNSGQPTCEVVDIKSSLKLSKKEATQREFLEYFAKQQKLDSETNRLAAHKSRSPEFKLRKQTTEKIQSSQKDILGKKRSSSRKPSRVDSEALKKAALQTNLQSLSRHDQSQTSNCAGLRALRQPDSTKGNLENNLKQLNLILKGHCKEAMLENSKNVEAMLKSEKFADNPSAHVDYNSKLLNQMKKFRIKSSKDRMQVLLNAKASAEIGNKSDLIARYMMKNPKIPTELEPVEPKPHQIRNAMSNAVLAAQKRSVDGEKMSGLEFFTKNAMHGSVHANSGHFDNPLRNKSRYQENEKPPNESKLESSWRNQQKYSAANTPELLPLPIDKSIKITRRERTEIGYDDPVPAPKLGQKRASSVGVDRKRVELPVKKKRGLSNNPNIMARKNLAKFVLKKRQEPLPSDSMRALQGSENRGNSRTNTLSNQGTQPLGGKDVPRQAPGSGKFINAELIRSNLMKKRSAKNG